MAGNSLKDGWQAKRVHLDMPHTINNYYFVIEGKDKQGSLTACERGSVPSAPFPERPESLNIKRARNELIFWIASAVMNW